MKFLPDHARDVALPSACLLVEQFFPDVRGKGRAKLVRRLSEFLMTTLLAFTEFHPLARSPNRPAIRSNP